MCKNFCNSLNWGDVEALDSALDKDKPLIQIKIQKN